jgi:ABC-type uncharacterized transport system permease subunit
MGYIIIFLLLSSLTATILNMIGWNYWLAVFVGIVVGVVVEFLVANSQ